MERSASTGLMARTAGRQPAEMPSSKPADLSSANDHMRQSPRNELRGTEVLEATMAVVVVAGALFLVMMGGLAIIALAVRREDRDSSLVDVAPGRLAGRTRKLNGFGSRD